MEPINQNSTDALDSVLQQLEPDEINAYLDTYTDSLVHEEYPFSRYMRTLIREKGLTQREVFERADLSDRYGYRLLTQEKNTRQRDYILRLCFGAKLTLQETQRALKLYGMSELYAKVPRDAVLMIAFNRELYEIDAVNALLADHDMPPLKSVSYVG
ncbi:MAG: helix-turn-helix domain-containing protein [Clostridiales bacterium]|nr:helix-turn-helix domain-containing protein [Clostridiales bacterium]